MNIHDTIAAVATPPGRGGVGIVRISGTEAEAIARHLFRTDGPLTSLASHRLYHGRIHSPETGEPIDEVLLVLMKAPRSYTGEDVVEIHGHGGPVLLRTLLAEILGAGARPAEPGEFTRRAFLNGRMDLAQAEAVADLIDARSAPAATLALGHLEGRLSRAVEGLHARTSDMLVLLEAAIDFGEEGETALDAGALAARFGEILEDLRTLLGTYAAGRVRREGFRVVITGRPNVGKSSLLNRLLGEERAIVTPFPGTTRDFIEETLLIEGIPFRLTDTAGIRTPEDAIEQAGVAMVRRRLSHADAILLLLDGSMPLTPEDEALLGEMHGRPTVIAVNKADLPHVLAEDRLHAFRPLHPPLWISAKTGEGIDALKALLYAASCGGEPATRDGALIGNLRHKLALEAAKTHLERGGEALERRVSPEFIALDVRDALQSLGEITGRTASPEILDKIFAGFCIGK